MQHLDEARRRAVVGTFLGALDASGGPTAEQARLLDAVGRHVFGLDPAAVEPSGPEESAAVLGADADAVRLVSEGLIVLELARHPPSQALTDQVHERLLALHGDDEAEQLARDYVTRATERVTADYQRLAGTRVPTPDDVALGEAGAGEGAALASRLDALVDCAPGSVGRSFHDFYTRHGLPWPERSNLVSHDFTHVLAGYEPVPEGEVALEAMLAATTGGHAHWSSLVASLLLFEVGMLGYGDIVPTESVLDRPGAADLFAEALVRGARCGTDFAQLDHLALVDRDLRELREELHIGPPPPGRFTFET